MDTFEHIPVFLAFPTTCQDLAFHCNGYYTNDNIIAQAEEAMDILEADFQNKKHSLIFDNAMTYTT